MLHPTAYDLIPKREVPDSRTKFSNMGLQNFKEMAGIICQMADAQEMLVASLPFKGTARPGRAHLYSVHKASQRLPC